MYIEWLCFSVLEMRKRSIFLLKIRFEGGKVWNSMNSEKK